jgi:exodeoxyribonuclease VII large subunit
LARNHYSGQVFVCNSIVQGNNCPQMVSDSLKKMDKNGYDVIVVTRGGGSLEDLFGFSHPKVIEAIWKCKTCVISAIGHEPDQMLSDFVADVRAATPSVAAETIALHQQKLVDVGELENVCMEIENELIKRYSEYKMMVSGIKEKVKDPKSLIKEMVNQYDNFMNGETIKLQSYYHQLTNELNSIKSNVSSPTDLINDVLSSFESFIDSEKLVLKTELQKISNDLGNYTNIINSKNPQNVLKNGYALITNQNDINIKSGKKLQSMISKGKVKKLKIVFKDCMYEVDVNKLTLIDGDS